MTRLTVLVGEDVGPANLARMRAAHPEIVFVLCATEAAFQATAPEAEIIFTKGWPADTLSVARRLRWIQAGTAGVERILAAGVRESDVLLTNATGAHGIPMSEIILSMMLAFATGLHLLIAGQAARARLRERVLASKFELEGQTLVVIGLGDIGGTLAFKAQRLGLRVLGVRRSEAPHSHVDEQYTPDGLLTILPRADHVALCLPLTRETRAIVAEPELRAMRPSAFIYNVGRGASIEAEALLRALREGWIAGAGLDVTDPEPLPDESPLWEMPNVILSQHTSGSSPLNADRITSIFLDNLERYLSGAPLVNLIDKQLGY
ncbi:MAG: D-2-hydroxyacid dehydrogenase [Anaerolineae bacterium]|nr:D-2-hydroxyacid dehydrogenase [Anaerolineae bacterium]